MKPTHILVPIDKWEAACKEPAYNELLCKDIVISDSLKVCLDKEYITEFAPEFLEYVNKKGLIFYAGKWWNKDLKIEGGYTTATVLKKYQDHLRYKHLKHTK